MSDRYNDDRRYPAGSRYKSEFKSRLGRNLSRSTYGLADDQAWANKLASQQLELNRLDWQAQQAASRGLISVDDYNGLRAESHANTVQRLMFGLGTKAEDTTGGAFETLADVLSLGSYVGGSWLQANIDAQTNVGNVVVPGILNPTKWGVARKSFLDAWQGRTSWATVNRRYDIVGEEGSALNFTAGLAADIFLDPTTYLTFGVNKGLKVGINASTKTAAQSTGRLTKLQDGIGHLSGFGYEIYKRAANRVNSRWAAKLAAGGEATTTHIIDNKELGQEGINEIASYAVEHFDELKAEYLADLTKGKWAAFKSIVAPASKPNQARILKLGEQLGVKIGGFGVDDMFQETASFLGKERGSTLLPEVISATQKGLVKLPVAGKVLEGVFDTFDHGWDVSPEILEHARITKIRKEIEFTDKVNKYQVALGAFTKGEREQISQILEARSRFEEVGKGTAASVAEYDPRIEEAVNFLSSEMEDIFRLETEAGLALNKVEDYVAHIVNPRVQKYYLEAIRKNGEVNLVGASRFTHQRMIASISEGEDLFGEGVFKKDAFEVLVARKRASIEMLANKEFLGKVVTKHGLPQAIVHAVGREAGALKKGIVQGWYRRAGYGVHEVITTEQAYQAEHGYLRELGFVERDAKGNVERLRYLNRPNNDIIREPGKGLSGKYSPEGEAEATRLNLPEAARLHKVDKVKGLEVEHHPIPTNLSWRPLKQSEFDVRQGYVQGGRHKVTNDMPKLQATTVLEALDDPDHPLWTQVLRGRVGTTGEDVYGDAAEAERLYGLLGYLHSYTTRWLDAPLPSLVPDVYEKALAILKKHGKETEIKTSTPSTGKAVPGPANELGAAQRADDTVSSNLLRLFQSRLVGKRVGLVSMLSTPSLNLDEVVEEFRRTGSPEHALVMERISQIPGIGKVKVNFNTEEDVRALWQTDLQNSVAYYHPTNDVIEVRNITLSDAVIVHEAVHAAVYNVMNQPIEALSKAGQKAVNDLLGLYDQAKGVMYASRKGELYGHSNVHEFVAEALSNREFQDVLRKIPYEKDYGKLGKIKSLWDSLWDSFTATLGRLLGFSEQETQSVLAKTFEAFDTVAKENPELRKLKDYSLDTKWQELKKAELDAYSELARVRDEIEELEKSYSGRAAELDETNFEWLELKWSELYNKFREIRRKLKDREVEIAKGASGPPVPALTKEEQALASLISTFSAPIEVRKVRPALPPEIIQLAKATRKAAGIGTDDAPVTPFLQREVRLELARVGFTQDMAKQLYRALFDGDEVKTVQQADAVVETLRPILVDQPIGALPKNLNLPPRLSDDVVPVNVRLARQVEKHELLPSRYDQNLAIPVAEGRVAKGSELGEQLTKETEDVIAKGELPESQLRFADRPGELSSRQIGKLSDEAPEGGVAETDVLQFAKDELEAARLKLEELASNRIERKQGSKGKFDKIRVEETKARAEVRKKIEAYRQAQRQAQELIEQRSKDSAGGGIEADVKVATGETTSDRLARLRNLRSMASGMATNTREADKAIARLDELIKTDPENADVYLDSKTWIEQIRSQLPTKAGNRTATKVNLSALDAELARLRSELAAGNLDATPSPTKGTQALDTKPVDEVVYLPKSVAKYLESYSAPGIDPNWSETAKKWIRRWDRLTQLYKTDMLAPFPAYHGRNFMTNTMIAALKGGLSFLDPSDNFARGRATLGMTAYAVGRYSDWPTQLLGLSKAKTEKWVEELGKLEVVAKNGRKTNVAELFDDMRVRGIIHGMQRAELAGQDDLWGTAVSTFRGAFAGGTLGAAAGAGANAATGTQDSDSYMGVLGAVIGGALGSAQLAKGLRKVGSNPGGLPMQMVDGATQTIQTGWKPFLRYGEAATELPFRTHLFLNEFIETGSMSQAADAVYRYMGDYHALSPIERRLIRRAIPFYGWMKTAFKNSAFQIVENPGNLAAVMKAGHNWNVEHDVDPEDIPDFLHSKFAMVVGQSDGTNPYHYYTPGVLPVEEVVGTLSGLNMFPGFFPGGSGEAERREFFSSVASKTNFPALTAVEALTGTDAFSGRPILESPGTKPGDWDAAPAFLQKLVGYEPLSLGKEATINNPKVAWTLGKIPASRFITVARQIQDLDDEGKKKLDTMGLARHLLGVGAVRVDPNSQRYFYNKARIDAMKNLLDHVVLSTLGEPPTSKRRSSFRYKRR